MDEEWRDVVGYEGVYRVSDQGRVMRVDSGYVRKPGADNGNGYLQIGLSRDGKVKRFLVHRLVLVAFCGESADKEVNHIDGCKQNNCLENLEWVSRSENLRHAFATGLKSNAGKNNPRSKLEETEVLLIRTRFAGGISQGELAKEFGVTPSQIHFIVRRKQWSHLTETETPK